MKRFPLYLFVLLLLGITGQATAQFQNALFELKESSNPNALERSGNIRKTSDGGFIIAATWGSSTFARAIAIKTDANFTVQWTKRFDDNWQDVLNNWHNQVSYGIDIVEVVEGQYAMLMAYNKNKNIGVVDPNAQAAHDLEFGLVKFKSDGTLVFAQHYGASYNDLPFRLYQTKDNGFIMYGYTNRDQNLGVPSQTAPYVVKVNSGGVLQWAYKHDSDCYTQGNLLIRGGIPRAILPTSDNGFVYAYNCSEHQYLVKINSSGAVQWTKHFVTAGAWGTNGDWGAIGVGYASVVTQIAELPNGNLAFAGNTIFYAATVQDQNGNWGAYSPVGFVFTTTATGDFVKGSAFLRSTGQSSGDLTDMSLTDMGVLPNGNFYFCGNTNVYRMGGGNNYYSAYLMEYDLNKGVNANAIRVRKTKSTYQQYANDYLYGYDLPHLYFNKSFPSKAIVVYDNKIMDFDNFNDSDDCTESVTVQSIPIQLQFDNQNPSKTNMSGTGAIPFSISDQSVSSTKVCFRDVLNDLAEGVAVTALKVYPNPAHDRLRLEFIQQGSQPVRVEICDMSGRILKEMSSYGGEVSLDVSNLAAGFYFVKVGNRCEKWCKE